MDHNTTDTHSYDVQDFTKDVAQTAAVTIGTLATFVVTGLVVAKIKDVRAARAAKKLAQTED